MGYYSDVCIALTANGYEKLKKEVNEYYESVKDDLGAEIRTFFKKEVESINKPTYVAEDGSVLLKYDNCKWYENDREIFPEVYAIMNALFELDNEDYYYLRSGEDYEDNDERGEFYDNPFEISIVKTIECGLLPSPRKYQEESDDEDNRMTM